MKATGIVRKFDENGRFVIPMEVRRHFGLTSVDDAVEVFTDGDCIVLKKYAPTCIFCDGSDELVSYKDKRICKKCFNKLGVLFED